MSTGNKYILSQYKYIKPLPQKINAADNVHLPNAIAEEIFQIQKINIKTLENKVAELTKQIKELKLENKTLCKANSLQEKELKKTNADSTGISFLTQYHKEEMKVVQSKVSSLQEQLKVSENNLKNQENIVLKKSLQIENLTAAKKQHDKHMKEMTLENKELKNEKDLIFKKYQELLEERKELGSRNEQLLQKVEQMMSRVSELEENVKSAVNDKAQMEKDLDKHKKIYDELEQNFSLPKPCPSLVVAETQTDDISNESSSYLVSDAGLKVCSKKSEVNSDMLYAMGDCWNRGSEYIKTKGMVQDGSTILTTDSVCKTRLSELLSCRNELISNLPLPKIQKSLLKPMKSRPQGSLTSQDNELGLFPIDSSFIINSNCFYQ